MATQSITPASEVPEAWRIKVSGTLINPSTLLATDYMNHFNEVVMMMDMLPMAPDMLADCLAWRAKSYPQHFLDVGLDYGPLAAEAYEHVPPSIKTPFELTTAQMNAVIGLTLKRAAAAVALGNQEELAQAVAGGMAVLRKLIGTLGGIINGSQITVDQSEIDALLALEAPPAPADNAAQSEIDKLFD